MEKFKTTKYTVELSEALKKRAIKHTCEYDDGHKHVDIGIPDAKIYIEIDGLQHYTDPKQIKADFSREYFSDIKGFDTIHIPNELIKNHLEEIAHAIAQVVKERLIK